MTILETWQELADTTDLGWPKWKVCGQRRRLVHNDTYWAAEAFYNPWWAHLAAIDEHIVACLFERHARTWLWEKHRVYVTRFCGFLCVHRDIGGQITEVLCTDGRIRECNDAGHVMCFGDDYALALQATVQVIAKEGKESPCAK